MKSIREQIEDAIMSAIDGRHDATEWFNNPDLGSDDIGTVLVDRLEEIALSHERSRDAWRKACRRLYDECREGGSKGRPMDLILKKDWHEIVLLIDEAVSSEPENRQ